MGETATIERIAMPSWLPFCDWLTTEAVKRGFSIRGLPYEFGHGDGAGAMLSIGHGFGGVSLRLSLSIMGDDLLRNISFICDGAKNGTLAPDNALSLSSNLKQAQDFAMAIYDKLKDGLAPYA